MWNKSREWMVFPWLYINMWQVHLIHEASLFVGIYLLRNELKVCLCNLCSNSKTSAKNKPYMCHLLKKCSMVTDADAPRRIPEMEILRMPLGTCQKVISLTSRCRLEVSMAWLVSWWLSQCQFMQVVKAVKVKQSLATCIHYSTGQELILWAPS